MQNSTQNISSSELQGFWNWINHIYIMDGLLYLFYFLSGKSFCFIQHKKWLSTDIFFIARSKVTESFRRAVRSLVHFLPVSCNLRYCQLILFFLLVPWWRFTLFSLLRINRKVEVRVVCTTKEHFVSSILFPRLWSVRKAAFIVYRP